MKAIKLFLALAIATAICSSTVFAGEEGCKGHKCCAEAKAAGKTCEKCAPKDAPKEAPKK